MRRAGQEQGRSRAEQSKAEQGRKRAGAGQELAVILSTLKYSEVLLRTLKYLSTYIASTQILLSTLKCS